MIKAAPRSFHLRGRSTFLDPHLAIVRVLRDFRNDP